MSFEGLKTYDNYDRVMSDVVAQRETVKVLPISVSRQALNTQCNSYAVLTFIRVKLSPLGPSADAISKMVKSACQRLGADEPPEFRSLGPTETSDNYDYKAFLDGVDQSVILAAREISVPPAIEHSLLGELLSVQYFLESIQFDQDRSSVNRTQILSIALLSHRANRPMAASRDLIEKILKIFFPSDVYDKLDFDPEFFDLEDKREELSDEGKPTKRRHRKRTDLPAPKKRPDDDVNREQVRKPVRLDFNRAKEAEAIGLHTGEDFNALVRRLLRDEFERLPMGAAPGDHVTDAQHESARSAMAPDKSEHPVDQFVFKGGRDNGYSSFGLKATREYQNLIRQLSAENGFSVVELLRRATFAVALSPRLLRHNAVEAIEASYQSTLRPRGPKPGRSRKPS